ncbi:hypothetical protein NQ317_016875 [Molorchus minor]|uniref:Uncharacterized protein n=1 Tax=Molorchus minor TaxID=1323400 RepID=A0ABQ9J6Z2_9CUCU|nr:hypothetical protein NQ317_016875 [Molorchus minor]
MYWAYPLSVKLDSPNSITTDILSPEMFFATDSTDSSLSMALTPWYWIIYNSLDKDLIYLRSRYTYNGMPLRIDAGYLPRM